MPKFVVRLLTFAALMLSLTGCGDQRILEDLGFIHTYGFDVVEQDQDENEPIELYRITANIPKANREGREKQETLSTMAITVKEARIKMSAKTELSLVSGQLRNTLFGTEFAKKGIWRHIDTL